MCFRLVSSYSLRTRIALAFWFHLTIDLRPRNRTPILADMTFHCLINVHLCSINFSTSLHLMRLTGFRPSCIGLTLAMMTRIKNFAFVLRIAHFCCRRCNLRRFMVQRGKSEGWWRKWRPLKRGMHRYTFRGAVGFCRAGWDRLVACRAVWDRSSACCAGLNWSTACPADLN